jgi:hypothetical protein
LTEHLNQATVEMFFNTRRATYGASSTPQPLNQVVNQAQTMTTVMAASSPGIAGKQETITATVQLVSGSAPLTDTVTFTTGTPTLAARR